MVGPDILSPAPCLSTIQISPTSSRSLGEKNMLLVFPIFCKKQMKQKITELYLEPLYACWYHTSLLLIIHFIYKGIEAF